MIVVSADLTLHGLAFGYRWWADHARASSVEVGDLTILCLRDSFTFGIGAGIQQSYPRQLEELLVVWDGGSVPQEAPGG